MPEKPSTNPEDYIPEPSANEQALEKWLMSFLEETTTTDWWDTVPEEPRFTDSELDTIYEAQRDNAELPPSIKSKMQPEEVDAWSAWRQQQQVGEGTTPEPETIDTGGNQFYLPGGGNVPGQWVNEDTRNELTDFYDQISSDPGYDPTVASRATIDEQDYAISGDPRNLQPSPGNVVGGQYIIDPETGTPIPVTTDADGNIINSETGEPIQGVSQSDIVNPFGEDWLAGQRAAVEDFNDPDVQYATELRDFARGMLPKISEGMDLDMTTQRLMNEQLKQSMEDFDVVTAYRNKAVDMVLSDAATNLKDFGEITGELDPKTMSQLENVAAKANQRAQNSIKRAGAEVFDKTIAQMVDKGILNANIGAYHTGKVADSVAFESGQASLAADEMKSRMWTQASQNKYNTDMQAQMQLRGNLTGLAGTLSGVPTGAQSSMFNYGASQPNSLDWSNYSSGISQWNQNFGQNQQNIGAQGAAGMWGIYNQNRGALANTAINAAANMYSAEKSGQAAKSASSSKAFGTILGGLASTIKWSSKRFKENIKNRRTLKLKNGKTVNLVSFNYKWDKKPQVGVIAEELFEVLPDAVITVNGRPEKVDYSILNSEVA